jgi:hypothetical protein
VLAHIAVNRATFPCTGAWVLATAAHVYVYTRLMPFRKGLPQRLAPFRRLIAFVTRPAAENYAPRYYIDPGARYLPWLWVTAALASAGLGCALFSL